MAAIARSVVAMLACAAAFAEAPTDVIRFLRGTATVLANAHENGPREFLDLFDQDMPQYATLRNYVEALVTRWEVGSAIEIVSDSGDEKRRTLQLDWLLEVEDHAPRRQIVKCTIEKRGKNWKFTSFEPVDIFKY